MQVSMDTRCTGTKGTGEGEVEGMEELCKLVYANQATSISSSGDYLHRPAVLIARYCIAQKITCSAVWLQPNQHTTSFDTVPTTDCKLPD